MILADKIIRLRKQNGWSQEELAERMNVSRQAVSKWEGAQAVPDLDKILQLSRLFGVTTDYLLKDELEDEKEIDYARDYTVKKITADAAGGYLEQRKLASFKIALATFLCILSPIALIVLCAASDDPGCGISQSLAIVLGLMALFAFILCAVPIYLYCGFKHSGIEFLDGDSPYELEREAKNIVTERKNNFHDAYVRWNIIATSACIVSPIPLIISAFAGSDMLCVFMLAVMIIIVGLAVAAFIVVGVQMASLQRLLREGDYSNNGKTGSAIREAVDYAYWGILTAIFLTWSFLGNAWHISWIVFVIGGVLSPIFTAVFDHIVNKGNKD